MADPLTQDERVGKLTTPFGGDTLALVRLDATEGLSELFEFRIEAVSLQANLDFNSALGLGSSVKLTTNDNLTRYFHGVMTEARWAGVTEDLYFYTLVLRPWFWLLTKTSDSRIFAQMSVMDIIKQVFSDRGFSDFRDATSGSPPTLEYCVQYRETDYNFVCRLMEEYGIYYFFEHSDGKHTLVLADAKSSHQPPPGLSSMPYIPVADGGRSDTQYVETWSRGRSAQTGKFVLNDYDYNKPPAKLLADSEKPGGYSHDSMEMYDYPGDYTDLGEGTSLAKYKVEAAQAQDNRRVSSGAAPSLFAGALITLERNAIDAENQEYLITHCSHSIDAQFYRTGAASGEAPYLGHYETIPSDCQFRAPLTTRKPEIAGVQAGLVVGQSGEEIDVDKLGRILVQFYWDRKKKQSRRVRVAQIWAGSNRGAIFVPRIGDEVVVQYEEGDPDRPIVTGSVYNGTNTVPLTLPGKKTKSGILTQSSKGGDGYHMFLFDDTAGSESIKLRSQKDLLVKALNDETRKIGVDQKEDIGNNLDQTVGGDKTVTVGSSAKGGNYAMTAEQKITLTVKGSSITIDPQGITLKAPTITFTADTSITAKAPSVSVTGDTEVTITSPSTSISA